MSIAQSLSDFTIRAQQVGPTQAAAELVRGSVMAPFAARRNAATFVAAFLGHEIEGGEQPYGYVGACERCQQVVKVPRAEPGILGRAVEFECPCAGGKR